MKTCLLCKAPFPPGGRGGPKYCKKCRAGSSAVCIGCQKTFTRKESGRVYCSTSCARTTFNQTHPEHQKRAGKAGGTVRGKQRTAEAINDWYVRKGGVFVHRIVAEEVLGRPLTEVEVVHHEDEDKKNNHPHNLIVFPNQGVHARHHKLGHCGLDSCDCGGIRLKEVMPR